MDYLFIVETLAQHGAERYLVEITKALRKRGHNIKVFSIYELTGTNRYYIPELEKYGISVQHFELKLLANNHFNNKAISYLKRFATKRYFRLFYAELNSYLQKEKNIYIIKWDLYKSYKFVFDKLEKLNICILSALAQYDKNPFEILPLKSVTFYIYYQGLKAEILQNRKFENINFKYVPLLIDNSKTTQSYSPSKEEFRIGVFSRISGDQPIIFSVFILSLLKTKLKNCSLHFFGRVYDEGFYKTLSQTISILKLKNDVHFHGHTDSISNTIKNNTLNVGLMNSVLGAKGYSSIELESSGLPVLYYDITDEVIDSSPEKLMFSSISDIADKLLELSKALEVQNELSDKVFHNAKKTFGIEQNSQFIDKFM